MLPVHDFFRRQFSSNPTHIVKAPGRLELLGNHTDYNEGLVLSLAVDQFVFMAVSPRPDGRVELASTAFPGKHAFLLHDVQKGPTGHWTDYTKGILDQLRKAGGHFPGFNAAIHGTIPIGSGLSSSAALLVATALSVRKLSPFVIRSNGKIQKEEPRERDGTPTLGADQKLAIARLCQQAENQFVGVQCGMLDYISSLWGKEHHAMEIDFKFLTIEQAPLVGEAALVVCESGARHELTGGEYNDRRRDCDSAARKLGVRSLRSIEPASLTANRPKLTLREYECAYHVVGEIQRVAYGERALREGDVRQFGQYMFQSHESSRDFFRNSCPELDLLVDIARHTPGCLGARLTGGGFGGATINLIESARLEGFLKSVPMECERRTGRKITCYACRTANGAG